MDRFEQGLKDSQQEKVMAYCDGCGGEIYQREQVRMVFNDKCVTHDNDECVIMVSNGVYMIIEQFLGLE